MGTAGPVKCSGDQQGEPARPQQPHRKPAPVALVTGSGAARVGQCIARHLAALGYRLGLHAHRNAEQAQRTAAELRSSGTDVLVLCQAFEDGSEAETLVDRAHEHFGRLDVLVNSAAIWSPTPLERVTAEELRRYFDVNAVATYMAARAAGLRMVDQPEGGAIINIGDWALARPYLDHSAYFPSKGAVQAITTSLAVELAHRNPRVRVNCILPGPVLLSDEMPAEMRQAVAASTLVKRVGTPQHIAHAVQFLVENDFVTGVCLPVDGGRTIYANDPLQTEYRTG